MFITDDPFHQAKNNFRKNQSLHRHCRRQERHIKNTRARKKSIAFNTHWHLMNDVIFHVLFRACPYLSVVLVADQNYSAKLIEKILF